MWAAWQLSVPASGLTCSDQRQPGSKVPRPTVPPERFTIATWPLPTKGRTSSAGSKLRTSSSAMSSLQESRFCPPTLRQARSPLQSNGARARREAQRRATDGLRRLPGCRAARTQRPPGRSRGRPEESLRACMAARAPRPRSRLGRKSRQARDVEPARSPGVIRPTARPPCRVGRASAQRPPPPVMIAASTAISTSGWSRPSFPRRRRVDPRRRRCTRSSVGRDGDDCAARL